MPPQSPIQIRFNNIAACLAAAADTLEILCNIFQGPFLNTIATTTRHLVKYGQTVKQNKDDCVLLMEQTHELLNAIIGVHIKSDTGGQLPPSILTQVGKFTETLHKIHTFIKAQQKGRKVKQLFQHSEASMHLKDCKAGLQQGLEFFQVTTLSVISDLEEIQRHAKEQHQEVLNMIEELSDMSVSDTTSSMISIYSRSDISCNSIFMFPSKPKIFHGREAEIAAICQLFSLGNPRIVILGGGGMGKTSLARAVVHNDLISSQFDQHRFFVACDSTATKLELVALVGAHLGLKPGKDLTRPVVQHLSSGPPCLLILDNLETSWEPTESRCEIEEFLSLLSEVEHLGLIITMRGAERPAKVKWTRPFLPPLEPLSNDAARQTFLDIADTRHDPEEVNKVLALTDNMPLAISLLAHLADSEGCSNVLSSWEQETTSVVSEGFDKRSNLALSISLSLSSPRIISLPQSQDLLSLLSILPDGLSDTELLQSELPIPDILGCKTALLRTSLTYTDEHKQLKALVPIREYMKKISPPGDHFIRPLLAHFQELLEFHSEYFGNPSISGVVRRISSNISNIQNIISNGLRQGHPDLTNSIYCAVNLNSFRRHTGQGTISMLNQIHNLLPRPYDYHLEVYVMTELFNSWSYHQISNPEALSIWGLKCFEYFVDTDIKCRFHISVGTYYLFCRQDLTVATNSSQAALSLAVSTGNPKRQFDALYHLAWIKWLLAEYCAANQHICEARRLAKTSVDLYKEACALRTEAMCWMSLGHYMQSMSLCNRARDLFALCCMSGGRMDHATMATQAEIHRCKSEYAEARNVHIQLLHEVSVEDDAYVHAWSLLYIAEIEMCMGAQQHDVQKNIDRAKSISSFGGDLRPLQWCTILCITLTLKDAHMSSARTLLQKALEFSWGKEVHLIAYCLERLCEVSCRNVSDCSSIWATVFLAHSIKFKSRLGINKALQFIANVSLLQGDEDTALSLYTVALDGFTHMDVHQSRAECMLRLGDISRGQGDMLQAVKLWKMARPLFERSSQARQIEHIDERLDVNTQI